MDAKIYRVNGNVVEEMDVVEVPAEVQELSFMPIHGRRNPVQNANKAESPRARKRRTRKIWLNRRGIDALTVGLSATFTIGLFLAVLGIQQIEQSITATGELLITGFLVSAISLAALQLLNDRI